MQKLNSFNKDEFIEMFQNVFEGSSWIAEQLYNLKPYKNFDDLKNKMIKIYKNSTDNQQMRILLNHPDLADKTKITTLTADSFKEQKNSKLDQCTEEEYNEFNQLNNKYKNKFGFPFILAVKNKSKNEILNIFRSRYLINKEFELKEAKKQVLEIASLRLNDIQNNFTE